MKEHYELFLLVSSTVTIGWLFAVLQASDRYQGCTSAVLRRIEARWLLLCLFFGWLWPVFLICRVLCATVRKAIIAPILAVGRAVVWSARNLSAVVKDAELLQLRESAVSEAGQLSAPQAEGGELSTAERAVVAGFSPEKVGEATVVYSRPVSPEVEKLYKAFDGC